MLTSLQAEAFAMQTRTRLSADTINERQAWLNLWLLDVQHIEHFKRSELALRPVRFEQDTAESPSYSDALMPPSLSMRSTYHSSVDADGVRLAEKPGDQLLQAVGELLIWHAHKPREEPWQQIGRHRDHALAAKAVPPLMSLIIIASPAPDALIGIALQQEYFA